MKQHLIDLVEQQWLGSQVVQTNRLEMSLASHTHLSGSGLFRLRLDTCVISISGVAGGVTNRFSRTSFFTPVSSDWNMECTFWIYPPMNLWCFAGNSLRGWGWCQISFHVIQTLKIQNGNSEMSPIRPCHPSFHPVPPPHRAHSWLLLLVSRGSFRSSFMWIQEDMMLFFLFSFAHKYMVNTLVWALLFPKRVAVTKSCVRFCVSYTILWALKMLSWFYQIANIVYFLLIFLKTFSWIFYLFILLWLLFFLRAAVGLHCYKRFSLVAARWGSYSLVVA